MTLAGESLLIAIAQIGAKITGLDVLKFASYARKDVAETEATKKITAALDEIRTDGTLDVFGCKVFGKAWDR